MTELQPIEIVAVPDTPTEHVEAFSHYRLAKMPGVRGVRVHLRQHDVWIEVTLEVFDRLTGKPTTVVTTLFQSKTSVKMPEWGLHKALLEAIKHEVHECLRFSDGRAVYEGHPAPLIPGSLQALQPIVVAHSPESNLATDELFQSFRLAKMAGVKRLDARSSGTLAYVDATLEVFDRLTGEPVIVRTHCSHHGMKPPTQGSLGRLLRYALVEAFEHELRECLRFADGTHVKDPHEQNRDRWSVQIPHGVYNTCLS